MQVELELKTRTFSCLITPVAGGIKLIDQKKNKIRAVLDLSCSSLTKSGDNLTILGARDLTNQIQDHVLFVRPDPRCFNDVHDLFVLAQKLPISITQLILDSSDVATVLCDDALQVIYPNKVYTKLLGSRSRKRVSKIFSQIPGTNNISVDGIVTVCTVTHKSITKNICMIEVTPSVAKLGVTRPSGTCLVVSELRHLQIENNVLRETLIGQGVPISPREGGKYTLGQILGKGKHGTVFLGTTKDTGRKVAIKRLPNKSLDLQTEIELLSQLEHPNIIRYYDCVVSGEETLIVTEYCNRGTLYELRQNKKLTHMHILAILYQVLTALQYLHEHKILHRDIKSTNILVNSKGYVKVADFGIALKINDSRGRVSIAGTPCYLAPEIVSELDGVSSESQDETLSSFETRQFKADIWSCGIVLLELIENKIPWEHLTFIEILCSLSRGDRPEINETGLPQIFRDLLDLMLVPDPDKRATAKDLLRHKAFNGIRDPTEPLRLWYT